MIYSFFAYDPIFLGGVRVGAADVNGDGKADIIVGAGPGGGPHVQVFSGATGARIKSFFAYDLNFPDHLPRFYHNPDARKWYTRTPEHTEQTAFRNAFIRALHNVINFLSTRAGLTRDDGYALSSIAVSFRITQVVDSNIGVHAMILKSLFDEDLRRHIQVA